MIEPKKFWWMIKKELISLKRHPARLVSILAFPIIMILLFGYGMGGEMTDLPIVVVSQSHGDLTDLTLDTIKTTETYHVVEVIDSLDEGKERVDTGEVKAAIILPSDYDEDTSNQKAVTLYLDSSDQMASQILESSTQGIFYRLSNMVASQTSVSTKDADIEPSVMHSLNNFKDDISLHINRIYGNIKYIDFLVPAILGMTIMMSCMMIELVRALILIFMAVLLFNVSIKGGFLQTFIVLVIGALCFVGFGIMLSARTQTQEDYAQISLPFSMPMMFVSGVFYPIETMPWILQKLAYIFPLTYLNDAMRGIMLKGQTLGDVWVDLVVLLGFTLLFFIIGVKRFNRDV